MKKSSITIVLLVIFAGLMVTFTQQEKEQVKNNVSIESEYEFSGGYPTDATIEKAFYQLDLQRVSQVYMEFMPLTVLVSAFDFNWKEGYDSHALPFGMKYEF